MKANKIMLKNTIKRWFIPAEKKISELEDMSNYVQNKMMYKIQEKIDINDTSRIYNIYLMDYRFWGQSQYLLT